jgi:hypothetical protein
MYMVMRIKILIDCIYSHHRYLSPLLLWVRFSPVARHIYVIKIFFQYKFGRICGELVSVLASECGRSWVRTKEYDFFSSPRSNVSSNPVQVKANTTTMVFAAALRRKSKYCLPRNQNNVSKWRDMSTRGLLL